MLRRLNMLDTPAETSFDRVSTLAARILNVPIALVSLVDDKRQFFKSCVGLPEPYSKWRETPLSSSFCKHVVNSAKPLILSDARKDDIHCFNEAIENLGAVAYLGCPLQKDGQVLGSFCVIDTEERCWTEEEVCIVKDLSEAVMTEIELRAKSEQHAAALRERERMLAVISHDLRAPLQTITTSMALLEFTELDDESLEYVEVTNQSVSRMNRMIEDLLDVSSMALDTLSVTLERVDVGSVVEEVHKAVALLAEDKDIEVIIDCAEPCHAQADRDRLLQALYNLLDNALRFTPAGGSIEITVRAQNGEVEFQVADTGPGIAKQDLPNVFDWAWHANRQGKGGTGLGLSITKGIVISHGGRIRVENRTAGGARFVFTLIDATTDA